MTKSSKSMTQLREQLTGMMERGLEEPAEEAALVPVEALIDEYEAPRQVPTRWGMRDADLPSRVTIEISEGDHYDFRLLVRGDGTTIKEALGAFIRACIDARRVFTEEDLEWLTRQQRD